MEDYFETGTVVKSVTRSGHLPLFLMVLDERPPSPQMFKAVVLLGKGFNEEEAGYVSNTWDRAKFEVSGWGELKEFIP